ncbi:unnamed protein product, partial [Rotaria sp. Silwood2]
TFLKPNQQATLFMIEAVNGKDLAGYTIYPDEHEVILGVGTQLRVKNVGFQHNNLHLVVLVEIDDDEDDDDNDGDQTGIAAAMATTYVTPKSSESTKKIISGKSCSYFRCFFIRHGRRTRTKSK